MAEHSAMHLFCMIIIHHFMIIIHHFMIIIHHFTGLFPGTPGVLETSDD